MPDTVTRVAPRALALAFISSLLAGSVAVASPAPGATHASSLSSLVLHLKDMPASLKATKEKGLNVTAANEATTDQTTASQINGHGFVGSYQTVIGNTNKSHALAFESQVINYKAASGAHWQYKKFVKLSSLPGSPSTLNTAGIGDEASGILATGSNPLFTLSATGLYFRRGHYVARIYGTYVGKLHAGDLLRLARIMDGRIKSAG